MLYLCNRQSRVVFFMYNLYQHFVIHSANTDFRSLFPVPLNCLDTGSMPRLRFIGITSAANTVALNPSC